MSAGEQVIAATPPMGWNSWNGFGPTVNERIVLEAAAAIVRTGLRDAGYRYVVIDDGWQAEERAVDGSLPPDPAKFPRGMKAVADDVHALGLSFGIYSGPGPKTCLGRPGSYGHEERDVATWVSWDVDFLKYDECSAIEFGEEKVIESYRLMGTLLRECGRPVVLSISTVNRHKPWLWAADAGAHMWRTTVDILDHWGEGPHGREHGIESIGFEQQEGLEVHAGPGRWNDPDMLVVGLNGGGHIGGDGCAVEEYRTHFGLWCMLAAPLMMGCDVRSLDDAALEILTHPEVIAVGQDVLGRQGRRVSRDGAAEIWKKELAGGDLAVGLCNRGEAAARVEARWEMLGIKGAWQVRDLWARRDLGSEGESVAAGVPAHGSALLRLRRPSVAADDPHGGGGA
jgi:alpha-galactosidase